MEIKELENRLHRVLKHTAAGISLELADEINQFEKLEITIENRQANIELEKGNISAEKATLLNRLLKEVEEEAREARPDNPKKGLRENVAALNQAGTDEEKKEGSELREKILQN